MTSVSAEPPMLLVCVNRNSIAHDAIAGNRRFAINVLNARQQSLAASFAGSDAFGPAYDFSSDEWAVSPSGLPQLVNPAAVFEWIKTRPPRRAPPRSACGLRFAMPGAASPEESACH